MSLSLEDFTYEKAREYIGDPFQISFDDGVTLDLKLEDVVRLRDKHVDPRFKRDPFAMMFRGPVDRYAHQGTLPIRHERLGKMMIFIVPVAAEPAGVLYEAIFN